MESCDSRSWKHSR
jgi:hypothetical protein